MSTSAYNLYINAVKRLAKSIVIKSDKSVDGLNKYTDDQRLLQGTASTDYNNPLTWKYYLNISGQYHFLDKVMYVVSLDTLELIEFTKANLLIHTSTAIAYQFGTRYYQQLTEQYPDQELLIRGILYPVDINTAINAKDGEILTYPSELVESNEYSLIPKLQKWIYNYKSRWYIDGFSLSDDLYVATNLAIMYLNLIPAILNFRLEACKTNEAHSFHVKHYLLSHGFSADEISLMTTKQALFFYRNIDYIDKNAGKQATFETLVENLLTERNLLLVGYDMHHDLTNMGGDNIYPNLLFYKEHINNQYDASNQTTFTLKELFDKEDPIARDNPVYKDDYLISANESMTNSTFNRLKTKMLETIAIDESNSSPFNLPDILLNHWIFLSSTNTYRAYMNLTNPKNGDTITLSAGDAFILAWYAFCNSMGVNVANVPQMAATRVQRVIPKVNGIGSTIAPLSDLMSIVDKKYVSEALATKALSLQPEIGTLYTTSSFYSLCNKIFLASQMQRNLVGMQGNTYSRSMLSALVSRIYSDNVCTFSANGESYATWLSARNIDISGLTRSELLTFFNYITGIATGVNLHNTVKLKDIQAAMIGIMKKLSSYSIQFLTDINVSNEIKTDWTCERVTDMSGESSNVFYIRDMAIEVLSAKATYKSNINYPNGNINIPREVKGMSSGIIGFKPNVTRLPIKAILTDTVEKSGGSVGIRSITQV